MDRRPFIVMEVEGILKKPIGGQVNENGRRLYRALSSQYQILLVAWDTRKLLDEWLYKEGITGYADLIIGGDLRINITENMWTNYLRYFALMGYNIELCVVNSPESALSVLERGVGVLLFGQPAYGLPEWLPGSSRGALDWADLAERAEVDALARRDDKRMEEGLL